MRVPNVIAVMGLLLLLNVLTGCGYFYKTELQNPIHSDRIQQAEKLYVMPIDFSQVERPQSFGTAQWEGITASAVLEYLDYVEFWAEKEGLTGRVVPFRGEQIDRHVMVDATVLWTNRAFNINDPSSEYITVKLRLVDIADGALLFEGVVKATTNILTNEGVRAYYAPGALALSSRNILRAIMKIAAHGQIEPAQH